ncbi:MAG: D-alanyl-D-alanine carboxypeptidase family protein [Caldimicrobium sp.]
MKKLALIVGVFFIFLQGFTLRAQEYYENINSLAGVALDGLTGQILYAKNPHIKIPPASTVKLLTAMVVLDRLPLSQKIRISGTVENISSTPPLLYEGEVYTVDDLLHLMLIKSSNQAAVALAEAVAGSEEKFSELMNQKARALGFKDSHFVTASGLPAPGQYTTAYELALLLYEALKYPHIKQIINLPVKIITSQQGRTLIVKNTNKLLFEEEIKEEIIGGKTGYTRLSKHCLVNVAQVKDRLVITSLLGAPYRDALWEDTKKLIKFSELVLERKVSPVIINTAINLSIPASTKPISYYKESRKEVLSKSLAKNKVKAEALAKNKNKSLAKNKGKVKIASQSTNKAKTVKKSKRLYTAQSKNQKNS